MNVNAATSVPAVIACGGQGHSHAPFPSLKVIPGRLHWVSGTSQFAAHSWDGRAGSHRVYRVKLTPALPAAERVSQHWAPLQTSPKYQRAKPLTEIATQCPTAHGSLWPTCRSARHWDYQHVQITLMHEGILESTPPVTVTSVQ